MQPRETSGSAWRPCPAALVLLEDEVHVWRADLGLGEDALQSMRASLTADERARAERYRFPGVGERFIASRGVLRGILGSYLGLEPGQVRLCVGTHGKPALANKGGASGLRFNLTHSHRLGLYAVAHGREVGVDVEWIRSGSLVGRTRIADRFFSVREADELRALPAQIREEAFFACWTRKEAYIKAVGRGLSLSLSQFEVSVSPMAPAALLTTARDAQDARRWSLRDLQPGQGYAGALAVEGKGWRLRCWQWGENA